MAAWYQVGEEGIERAKKMDEESRERRKRGEGAWRFRQANNSSSKVIFLETPWFFFLEHNIQTGRKRWEPFTCLSDEETADSCPYCDEGFSRSYVVATTIISLNPYTDKKGNEHKVQKMLFIGKGAARDNLVRQISLRKGDLQFCVFDVARGGQQNEPSTGSDFNFIKKFAKEQLKKIIPEGQDESWLDPFDYAKILAPLPIKKAREVIGASPPVGSDENDSGGDLFSDLTSENGEDSEEDNPVESIEDLM